MKAKALAFLLAAACTLPLPEASSPAERGKREIRWLALFLDGRKMGHMILSRRIEDDRVTTSVTSHIEAARGAVLLSSRSHNENVETPSGKPLGFSRLLQGAGTSLKIAGTIGDDGSVSVITLSGSHRREKRMPWPAGALMSEGMRLLIIGKGFAPGTETKSRQFVIDTQQTAEVTVRIAGRKEIDVFGKRHSLIEMDETVDISGRKIMLKLYVDESLNIYRMEYPMMGKPMVALLCDRDYALSRNNPTDFLALTVVRSPRRLNRTELSGRIRYSLSFKKPVSLPATAEQSPELSPENMIVRVTVRKAEPPRNAPMPYRGNDPGALRALGPTHYVQSDNAELRGLARKAAGNAANASEAAARIEEFVSNYIIKKNLNVGFASAVEVMKNREGDCTEHAVLTAALCRASGIPARLVFGLAYSPFFEKHRDVFIPHAWTQVYLGDGWYNLDSALGFDAGHIALGTGRGDSDDFFNLENMLGSMEIRRIEVQ